MPTMRTTLRTGMVLLLAALAGCTYVDADLKAGTATVWTFATSRQDVAVGCAADGVCTWTAKSSDADTTAVNALAAIATKTAGVP